MKISLYDSILLHCPLHRYFVGLHKADFIIIMAIAAQVSDMADGPFVD